MAANARRRLAQPGRPPPSAVPWNVRGGRVRRIRWLAVVGGRMPSRLPSVLLVWLHGQPASNV